MRRDYLAPRGPSTRGGPTAEVYVIYRESYVFRQIEFAKRNPRRKIEVPLECSRRPGVRISRKIGNPLPRLHSKRRSYE